MTSLHLSWEGHAETFQKKLYYFLLMLGIRHPGKKERKTETSTSRPLGSSFATSHHQSPPAAETQREVPAIKLQCSSV